MNAPVTPQLDRGGRGLQRLFLDDHYILVAILLNAVVLTALGFPELRHNFGLEVLDHAFTTYFVIEAVLKIRRDGFRGYISLRWNQFDFAIVVVSLPSYAMLFMDIPDLSWIFLLRILRVTKFFRFIRFVPDIGQLIDGGRRALRASFFVLIAFFVFNFVVALLSCQFFHDEAPEYFGNPVVSFYSIFKVFTVEGWYEIPDTISERVPSTFAFFVRIYFMGVVVFGGLLGLSLVNAIFVDEMMRNENDVLEARLEALSDKLDRLLASQSSAGRDHDNDG
jgi:voltage-gated sodium channel